MTIRFTLPYRTTYGQRLAVCGSDAALGAWRLAQALPLHYDEATARWSAEISLPATPAEPLTYKYVLLENHDQSQQWEWGPNRRLSLADLNGATLVELNDFWRTPGQAEHELFTNAFMQVLFRRAPSAVASPPSPLSGGEGGLVASASKKKNKD